MPKHIPIPTYDAYRAAFAARQCDPLAPGYRKEYLRLYQKAHALRWPFPHGGPDGADYRNAAYQLPAEPYPNDRWTGRIGGYSRPEPMNTEITRDYYDRFRSQGCLVCGEDTLCCLEAHHLDPTNKTYSPAAIVQTGNTELLAEELAKCVVLCSNCHRKHHAGLVKLTPALLRTHIPPGKPANGR